MEQRVASSLVRAGGEDREWVVAVSIVDKGELRIMV